jgi:Tol biopolymer transport system component
MGEVYKATDTRLDRTVAIKVLPEHVASDPELKHRFEREAKTLASLSHPHICNIHDVGSQNGIDFLVMEYLDGETLEQRLKKGALSLEQALQTGIQIADALTAAHRAGIIHRDLKPGNIMLTKSGAQLLDFGLAKLHPTAALAGMSVAATVGKPLTGQGTILGTLHYMAPEQVEGREADTRTDISAIGAVLYEMVTGKKAFEGKSHASLIAAILEREPPAMSSLQPLVPPVLDRIVRTCLAKEADDRWQTARDLLRELRWAAADTEKGVAGRTAAPTRSPTRVVWALGAVAALAIAALAVVTTLYARRAIPERVVTRLDVVTPPTTDAFSFALSPDGRQLAFLAYGERGPQLWLRPLDQVNARPLAGTEGGMWPFWAPDGRAIGFFADAKLKRIDLVSGATQVLADAPAGRGGTWSPDGVIVFAPATNGGLLRVAATGGTAEPVTSLPAGPAGSHRWPQFLPDGRRFLFVVGYGRPDTTGVHVGSIDGGEPTRVLPALTAAAYATSGHLLLVTQGVLVAYPFDAVRGIVTGEPVPVAQPVGADDGVFRGAFSVSALGVLAHRAGTAATRQLLWVDRAGKVMGTIGPVDQGSPSYPELSPDGQRVAVLRVVQGNPDVWFVDVGRGAPTRFTFDTAIDSAPLWSPDGSKVIFRSSRNGVWDLFEKPSTASADEQPLLITSQDKGPQDWSRDGRFLLYTTHDPKTYSDLWVLPLTAERKPFPVVQSSFDDIEGQFSPDGRWLAYASNESGRYEIYVRPFPNTGGQRQISTAGGMQPRWRSDGGELFFVAPDTQLMAASIRFALDTRALDAGAPVPLFPSRLATGGNITSAGFQARAQYAVSADGRFLMNVAPDGAVTLPITIVQNWDAALKK